MSRSLEPEPIDQKLVAALGHPLRVQILQILNEREASPKEIATQLASPIGHVSYHTNVLVDCDCITLIRIEPRRGALEHFFRAEPRSFIGHQDWRNVPRSLRGDVTAAALKTFMGRAVAALKAGIIDDREDTTLTWFNLAVDRMGWAQVAEIMDSTLVQLQGADAQSRQRAAVSGEALTPVVVGLAAFEAARRGKRK